MTSLSISAENAKKGDAESVKELKLWEYLIDNAKK